MGEPTTTIDRIDEDCDTEAAAADDVLIAEELLIEEISIDGMCGVY